MYILCSYFHSFMSQSVAVQTSGVMAHLHRPEAITKLVPRVYYTNILQQQIKKFLIMKALYLK